MSVGGIIGIGASSFMKLNTKYEPCCKWYRPAYFAAKS